jgi:hypothetical protein
MIRCFSSSAQGWRRCAVVEGVPCLVDTPAHSVGVGGAGLVAPAPGGAGCAHVLNLDFVSKGSTVALLVLGGFD